MPLRFWACWTFTNATLIIAGSSRRQTSLQQMISRFSDPQGGFFDAPRDADRLCRSDPRIFRITPRRAAIRWLREALLKLAALGGRSDSIVTWPSKRLRLVVGDVGALSDGLRALAECR